MFTPQQYRAKAAECGARAALSNDSREIRELHDLERSFTTLADNEQWVADNFDQVIHSLVMEKQENPALESPSDVSSISLSEEDGALRCLGAALIMQWNTLPTKLQKELLDAAGAIENDLEAIARRGSIASLLHKYQNGEAIAAHSSLAAIAVRTSAEDAYERIAPDERRSIGREHAGKVQSGSTAGAD